MLIHKMNGQMNGPFKILILLGLIRTCMSQATTLWFYVKAQGCTGDNIGFVNPTASTYCTLLDYFNVYAASAQFIPATAGPTSFMNTYDGYAYSNCLYGTGYSALQNQCQDAVGGCGCMTGADWEWNPTSKKRDMPPYRGKVNETTGHLYPNVYGHNNGTHIIMVTQYDDEAAFDTLTAMWKDPNRTESDAISQYIIAHQTEYTVL